jgi:hypothetical protein
VKEVKVLSVSHATSRDTECQKNIIWSNFYSIRVEGQIIEDHNIYWGGRYNITLSPTSMYADPLFISPDTFRLQENSPAIGKGVY